MPSRRAVLATGLAGAALALLTPPQATSGQTPSIRIADDRPGRPVSRLIYGANEIGVMDGGLPSATLDARAGVTARRLGGDLMTAYNWVNNATNAGKNHKQANGAFLLEALQVPQSDWSRPGVIIEVMHEASLAMHAKSLVTLPISPYAAADFDGPVSQAEAAPSKRFVEVQWSGRTPADDPVNSHIADMPHLVARLLKRYGDATSARGIHAYALDNEPGLWFENHPRVTPSQTTIRAFISRSIAAARVIKSLDPAAKIFGPASWGATEMVNFQNAPDRADLAPHGSFLAAYLDAFRKASEQDGQRLLDVLDVHWYPFHRSGNLFRTETPGLDRARLDAPRSLTEAGFVEDSWVPRALRNSPLGLPILPSLQHLAARWFPGTELAVTEFNYGGAGRQSSALALADALGRFGVAGVYFATHWGSLADRLGEAYRLYRAPDAQGRMFGDIALEVGMQGAWQKSGDIRAYAARDELGLQLVVLNTSTRTVSCDLVLASSKPLKPTTLMGFDEERPQFSSIPMDSQQVESGLRLVLPALSARRYAFT